MIKAEWTNKDTLDLQPTCNQLATDCISRHKKGVEETMRFRIPKNGHYTCYCYGCKHYAFERQVGCAYIGKCSAIEGEPTEADAYDPPCGLWEKGEKREKRGEQDG